MRSAGVGVRSVGHKDLRLQALDGFWLAGDRDDEIGCHIGHQAPEYAVGQRIEGKAEQPFRMQQDQAERSMIQNIIRKGSGPDEVGNQKRISPYAEACEHAGHRAARRATLPDQADEKGRRHLRDGGKGQKPDLCQRGGASGHAVIEIGHQQDGERSPPCG
jgi:hypothetical protein